jgi:hypothetical protein
LCGSQDGRGLWPSLSADFTDWPPPPRGKIYLLGKSTYFDLARVLLL